MKLVSITEKEKEWVKGKSNLIYALLFVATAYVGVKQVIVPTWQSLIDVVNFGIHELGHPIFSLFGNFMHALGGTISEIGVPLAVVFILYEQRMYFASAMASIWLTTALYSVSVYASDAQARELPLSSIYGEVDSSAHDWHYMLSEIGWLEQAQLVGQIFAVFGIIAAVYGIYRGGALLNLIFRENHKDEREKATPTD